MNFKNAHIIFDYVGMLIKSLITFSKIRRILPVTETKQVLSCDLQLVALRASDSLACNFTILNFCCSGLFD